MEFHPIKKSDTKAFLLAGNATLTLKSNVSGTHFTYRVRQCEDKELWFVAVMTGTDNENDFSYLGCIYQDRSFKHGRKSKIGMDAASAKAFAFALPRIIGDCIPDTLSVYHSGTCCRCGRKLTTPESIQHGIGPECIKMVGNKEAM